ELSRATAAPATAASTAVPSITASPAAPAASGKPPTSSPSSVQQLLSQASLLMSQGKLDEAIAILNKTLAIDAKSTEPLRLRTAAWTQKPQFAKALADADFIVRLTATDPKAYSTRGYARLLAGQPDAAMGDFDRALTLDARDADAHVGRAQVF